MKLVESQICWCGGHIFIRLAHNHPKLRILKLSEQVFCKCYVYNIQIIFYILTHCIFFVNSTKFKKFFTYYDKSVEVFECISFFRLLP